MRFDCGRCSATDAIVLPDDPRIAELVCPACHARQPRRDYELLRLQRQLSRARDVAAKQTARTSDGPPDACPSCGDDLFTPENGCTRCGHGQRGFAQRGGQGMLLAIVFVVVLGLGLGAIALVGVIGPAGPLPNAALVAGGAALFTFGVHALRRPTSLVLSDNLGTDAFGMQQWGNDRPASEEQGTWAGALCVVIGLGLCALGVVAGLLI